MQKSFSDLEYATKKKLTWHDRFLAEIDSVTPWGKLHRLNEPLYPKVESAGRPPIGLARMLRMYVAQQCFGLSNEGIEDAIYNSQSIRAFVGIDLDRESAPDATNLAEVPPPAGSQRADAPDLRHDQRALGQKGSNDARKHHRRRHADCRAAVDQKQGRQV
jgi:hypothetical protein